MMGWARLDDKRADNEKLMAAGFEARGLDEAAICWCAGHESDGVIPETAVAMLAVGHGCKGWRKVVARLVGVGRWHAVDGGWELHDYLDYNPSRAQVTADRDHKSKVRSEAGRRGGLASGEARREAKPKQVASEATEANGKHVASEATNPRPVPSRPLSTIGLSRTRDGDESRPLDGDKRQEDPETSKLIERWVSVCDPRMQAKSRGEAAWWMPHLLAHLSFDVIDENIGRCLLDSASSPRSINYLVATCRDWASKNMAGHEIPAPPKATA